ncbi:transposase [Streptomyces sp. NPDC002540]
MPDDLWARVVPLLPQRPERRHRHARRHRLPDRTAPAGIPYMLRTEVAWRDVPRQVMAWSGIRARRRRGRIGRRGTACHVAHGASTQRVSGNRTRSASRPGQARGGRPPTRTALNDACGFHRAAGTVQARAGQSWKIQPRTAGRPAMLLGGAAPCSRASSGSSTADRLGGAGHRAVSDLRAADGAAAGAGRTDRPTRCGGLGVCRVGPWSSRSKWRRSAQSRPCPTDLAGARTRIRRFSRRSNVSRVVDHLPGTTSAVRISGCLQLRRTGARESTPPW